jgi:DnaJ-class molecular chaperone
VKDGMVVRVANTCSRCDGSGKTPLPSGQFLASGESEGTCPECAGAKIVNKRWIPIEELLPK